jgi:hypothetical protein
MIEDRGQKADGSRQKAEVIQELEGYFRPPAFCLLPSAFALWLDAHETGPYTFR